MVLLHDFIPTSFGEAGHELNCCRKRTMRRDITRSRPVKLMTEPRCIAKREGHSMTDGQRVNVLLFVLSHMKKCGTFGGAKPLVAVACGIGCA